MKRPGIYIIRNQITKALYVGHASNTQQRIRQHRHRLNRGDHNNPHLQSAWKKYGENAFKFRHMKTIECWIDRCNTEMTILAKIRDKGRIIYNVGTGGEGQPHTTESRRKISNSKKGKKASAMARQNMCIAQRGHPPHPNAIAALSKYWKGRKRGPMSEETKRKVSLAKTGKPGHKWSQESIAKRLATMRGWKPSRMARQRMSKARYRALERGQRSRIKLITFNGFTMCIKDWAIETGIDRTLLGYRLGRGGWTIADALTTPVNTKKCPNKHRK